MLRKEVVNAIVEEVRELLPELSVESHEAIKNNGIVLNGVVIRKENEDVAPTIYIENYVNDKGFYDVKRIASEIVNTYRNEIEMPSHLANVREVVTDFSKVAPLLRIRLINKENNAKLFETVPYMPFLDMAIIVVIELESDEDGCAAIKVTHNLLKAWGYAALSDILPIAKINTFSNPYEFKSMAEILAELSGMPIEFFNKPPFMYVLTNKLKLNGAMEICNYDTMESIAEQLNSDLIVLPSSIHEVIIVAKDDSLNIEELTQMVQKINGSEVAADEVLSNHTYIFTREDGWDF